jgi:hypothetical protein
MRASAGPVERKVIWTSIPVSAVKASRMRLAFSSSTLEYTTKRLRQGKRERQRRNQRQGFANGHDGLLRGTAGGGPAMQTRP